MMAILTAILSAAAAFIGAWLAARLALDRYYHERVWDKRSAAYTAIFDALHDFDKWFAAHESAAMRGSELPIDQVAQLAKEYQKAGADLQRRVASETWLISDAFRERLDVLEAAMSKRYVNKDWVEFFDESQKTITSAIDDLRRIARSDLSIE